MKFGLTKHFDSAFVFSRCRYRSAKRAPSGCTRHNKEEFIKKIEGGRQMFSSKLAKLEFPIYFENDPTKWFHIVDQFF